MKLFLPLLAAICLITACGQPPPRHVVVLPLTPEQEAEQLTQKSDLTADEIAAFCQRHPHAQSLLYGKTLAFSGKVKSVGVFGLEKDRAEIVLTSHAGRVVVLECYPEKTRQSGRGPYYAATGGHLFYRDTANNAVNIASVGITGNVRAVFHSVTPASIRLIYLL